jgi:putative ABC transport system permease protein
MLKNYFKIIARSFSKNRGFNFLNLSGLAIGFTACMLIVIYVVYETSFDNFHTQADRIYRLTVHYTSDTGYDTHFARVDADWTKSIPDEIPEVERLVRFQNHEPKFVRIGNEKFTPQHAYSTDPYVFDVFDFNLLKGDPKTALAQPYAVVLTQSMAKKYFGDEDAFGRDLVITRYWTTDEEVYKITGIMEDLPGHTHLPVDMLFSFRNEEDRGWWAYTYLLLKKNATVAGLKEKIEDLMVKNQGEQSRAGTEYVLWPLQDIHLHSNLAREIIPNGNLANVKIFTGVGIFILLLAMINFINLNSVIAIGRAKEIGIRKVMGSRLRQLIFYSLTESTILCFIAAILATGLTYLVYPYFHQALNVSNLLSWETMLIGLGSVVLTTGIISGFYPAFVLSAVKPVNVMKNTKAITMRGNSFGITFRKALITAQFAICILLVGSAIIGRQQFLYLKEKNLGMKKEQVLALTAVPDTVKDKFKTFKDELSGKSGIEGVTACLEVPSREIRDGGNVWYEGMTGPVKEAPIMDIQVIDHDFIEVMGMELLAGEPLSKTLTYDPLPEFTGTESIQQYLISKKREYIINETAMHKLGWTDPNEVIGKQISWTQGTYSLDKGSVVGVVKDFHQESLKNAVDPVVMVFEPLWLRTFLVKLSANQISEHVAEVEKTWNTLFPQYPFEYVFLDELFDKLYKQERNQLNVLFTFSGLTIIIAFLGLFGLVAYSLKTRTKEIAVRRVFGASQMRIIKLFGKEYVMVILIATLIAVPLSYTFVSSWLRDYAFRVNVSWGYYGITLLLIIALLGVTILYHTLRTTSVNPSVSLRED